MGPKPKTDVDVIYRIPLTTKKRLSPVPIKEIIAASGVSERGVNEHAFPTGDREVSERERSRERG